MAILVIGCVTRDTLVYPHSNWRIQEGLGGILYTINCLSAITDEKIIPVCNVGSDIFHDVSINLKRLKNIDYSGVRKVDEPNIHCYILYASEYGTQYDEGFTVPTTYTQIKPLLADSTFILVSPMTGFDIELRTLQQIKQAAKCPIYLDYHLLALGKDRLGNRYIYRRKDWQDWCACCDHLQLNKFEAEILNQNPINSELEIIRFADLMLPKMVKSVAVTLGDKGSLVCWKDRKNNYKSMKIGITSVINVPNTTGCGDVFAASFISHFLKTNDFLTSYKFANWVAGIKCSVGNLDDLSKVISSIIIGSGVNTIYNID